MFHFTHTHIRTIVFTCLASYQLNYAKVYGYGTTFVHKKYSCINEHL